MRRKYLFLLLLDALQKDWKIIAMYLEVYEFFGQFKEFPLSLRVMPSSRVSVAIRGKIGAVTFRATIGGNGARLDGSQVGRQPTEKFEFFLTHFGILENFQKSSLCTLSVMEEAELNHERLEISSMQQKGFKILNF